MRGFGRVSGGHHERRDCVGDGVYHSGSAVLAVRHCDLETAREQRSSHLQGTRCSDFYLFWLILYAINLWDLARGDKH